MRFRAVLVLLFAFLILLLPCNIFGQAFLGSIKGQVLDPQKAGVPRAQITLENEATGVVSHAVSGASGQFTFLNLSPGSYSLTTRAKGFRESIQKHVEVHVGASVSVTIALELGNVSQSITVSVNPASLNTQTSSINTTVTPQEIKDLPVSLSGDMRNPLNFVLLTPGVYGSTPGPTPDYRLHISGAPSYSNQVYVDGIPEANTNLLGAIGSTHPPIDAISEFKIINNNASARYGYSPSIVSFAIKSGTNQFHGSLFDYLQNDALNAAGFDANALGGKKAPLKQNEFGGTIGGPVIIPHVYNGHDRTFFFVDYTGFKFRPSSVAGNLTTIPNEERTGNFSQSLGPQLTVDGQPVFDPAGRPVYAGEIYNPFSVHTVVGPDGKSYPVRDPFPRNIIPTDFSGLSPVSQKVLNYFPTADSNGLFNNYVRTLSSKIDEHRLVAKVDENINAKNAVFGSFQLGGLSNSNNGGLNLYDAITNNNPSKEIRFTYNFTPSATVVNNLNIGFLRETDFAGPLLPGPGLAALGITGLPALATDSPMPIFAMGTLTNSIGTGTASAFASNRFIVNDNLTIVHGNHTLTLGGDLRYLQRNESGIATGNFTFEPTQTALNGIGFINGNQAVSLPVGTGNPVASFLFGGMDFSRFDYPISQYYRWTQTGYYFQDDWKVRPDLTLDLGLRWDLAVPRTEIRGNVSTMDPNLSNPAAGGLPGAFTFYGKGTGRNGKTRIGNTYYGGIQPRIGLAYSPGARHRTVFRAGFGVTRPLGNDLLENGIGGGLYDTGFAGLATINRPQDYVGSPAYYWDNAFPASSISGATINPGLLVGNDNPPMIHPDAGMAPTQLYWTAEIQRQVGGSMVARAAYVGMHTYHLGVWAKPNQINPAVAQEKYGPIAAADGLPLNQFLALPITDPRAAAAGITSPFPNFVSVFGPGATIGQALRPWPQYGDTDNPFDPIGSISYNGLQTSFQKRFSKGLTFLVSYTFSKTIGDVDSNNGPFSGAENAIYAGSFYQNYYDLKSERNVTSSDIPNVLSISYTYQLPFGPGKHFLNHGGALGKVVGGWEVSGIQNYQSGRPIHIEYDAFGSSNPYFGAGDGFSFRPDLVPGVPLKNPDYSPNCSGPVQSAPGREPCQFYINPAAFSIPPAGQFGNAPNLFSNLRMPAYLDEDLSVAKRIPISERVGLRFQANFFNAFNRVVFSSGGNAQTFIINGAPANLSSSALDNSSTIFGIMTNQQNGPRIIQLSLQLEF